MVPLRLKRETVQSEMLNAPNHYVTQGDNSAPEKKQKIFVMKKKNPKSFSF